MAAKSFPVLFVAPEGVSEAVLASGLLRKLHDEAPNPRFTIVANRQVAALYADMPKVEQVVVTERKPSKGRWFGLLGPLRARRWALVVDLPSGVVTGRLRPRGKALRRASQDEPEHKLIEAARLMRLEEDPPAPYLFVSEATEARAAALTAGDPPILAVAPTADWVGKSWPIERFAEATRRLLSPNGAFAGGRLMILGEKADAHEVDPVRSATTRDMVIDLVGKDPLTVFAALRRARLFIGNDTGFSQLAAAAVAPTLALFGPSDDRIWRPWGENVRVVRGARTLEELLRVDSSLSAQVRHMIDLSADSVLSAAESLMEETESRG